VRIQITITKKTVLLLIEHAFIWHMQPPMCFSAPRRQSEKLNDFSSIIFINRFEVCSLLCHPYLWLPLARVCVSAIYTCVYGHTSTNELLSKVQQLSSQWYIFLCLCRNWILLFYIAIEVYAVSLNI
jgi:hypothetical protein